MRSVVLVLFLLGCSGSPGKVPPTTPSQKGVPVYVSPGAAVADDVVRSWVDLRAAELVENKTAWGFGYLSDDAMWAAIRSRPIIVYPGHLLSNGKIGWNYYGSHIAASLDWPQQFPIISYDPQRTPIFGDDGNPIGLNVLPHEFKHTLLGDWHPE